MKQSSARVLSGFHQASLLRALLLLNLLLLTACSSYNPSHNYPQGHYSYPAGAAYSQRNYAYYGAYQPGWFVAAPYYPGNYWGYGAMVYWPTYSSSYYYSNHYYGGRYSYGRYYPYSDPWYNAYGGHYRHVYGHYYGPYNGPGYGYGPAGGYWNNSPGYRGNSGSSHSYRPPGGQEYNRPEPVVIPRDQRGRRGAADGYSDEIDGRQRDHESYQPERRSATVITEREGMSSAVVVAPVSDGARGMVVSNRSERKVQPSRLHPDSPIGSTPGYVVAPSVPALVAPVRQSSDPGRVARNPDRATYRAPGRSNPTPTSVQPALPRIEPSYTQPLDSNSASPQSGFQQSRDTGNGNGGRRDYQRRGFQGEREQDRDFHQP